MRRQFRTQGNTNGITRARLEVQSTPLSLTISPTFDTRRIMNDSAAFPDDFLWGAATSAYQIEGSPLADGAGPSNWHRFVRIPGAIVGGDTGDLACDHYRRYKADVELMRQLGLKAYRFSISWSRIFPEGRGKPNPKGLDFYQRLVDELLAAGIEPFPTLFHWDLPAILDDAGGWVNRDICGWFADYAHLLFRNLGPKVKFWTTLNEPWVVTDAGYVNGTHAPGHRSLANAPWVSHHLLRAHALAVQAFRADGQGQIGLVVNLEPKYAATERPEDLDAQTLAHAYMNRQYLDPVLLGTYPETMADIFGRHWPEFPAEDMALLREPVDFIGINYYTRSINRFDPRAKPVAAAPVRQDGAMYTEMDWEVFPQGLCETLAWIKRRYGDIPLYITENGAAFRDPPPRDGLVDDQARVDYFRSHLLSAREAIGKGVNLRGYFAWSLFDNFEWSFGYAKRFGLIHVDHASQRRTPKASAEFYAEVIATGGACIDV
jgi:beta-glucosidase